MIPRNDQVKELLNNSSKMLSEQLKYYKMEDDKNMKILQSFKLDDLLTDVPIELFSKNQEENQKLNRLSNELLISHLDKTINIFEHLNSKLEDQINFIKKGLTKYEEESCGKLGNVNQDFLDISVLETSIEKLQMDIHQANNQEQPAKDVVNKLKQCIEMKNKIDQFKAESKAYEQEIQTYRLLPPDIHEAEKKLNYLEQKYRETCKTFSLAFQKGS